MKPNSIRPGRRLAVLALILLVSFGFLVFGASALQFASPDSILSSQSQFGAVISVRAQAGEDLQVEKTHAPPGFTIGSNGVYTITISNVSSAPVSGPITVTDVLDQGYTYVSDAGQAWDPCDVNGQTVTCVYSNTNGVAASQALPPLALTVGVEQVDQTQITNTAIISNTNDTNPDNNSADDLTQINGLDLAVTKSVTPTNPVENEIITYTLRVDNFGPNDATGVNLTDVLPTGITFVSSNATQGTYTPGSGLWAIGGLSNGGVVTLTLSASVNPNTRGATIINAVSTLIADQEDPFQSNNTASVSFTVATTRLIGIVTDASTDEPLEDVTVRLTDSAQTGYTTQTNASGWYTFTSTLVNPIAAGSANVFVELEGYADANLTPNLIAGQDNRLDIPLDTADLVVTLTDGKTTMLPGEVLTYTLTVANTGSITATNVIITDVFDTRQEFITHTLDITYSEDSATTFVWNLEDDIPPDDQISFGIAVKVDDALPSRTYAMTNQAMAATDAPEADLSDNMKLDTDTGTGTPSLTISKSVSPSSVETNEDTTYRIRVENTGNVPVTDVLVYDTFSTYFDLRSATTNIGTVTRNNSTRRVDVSIDVLEPDDEVDIRVVARVNTTARSNQTVSNQADMEYTFGGIEYTRRSGTASVRIIATSTLPGTGGIELSPPKEQRSRAPVIAAGLSALLLGLLGAGALGYALRARKSEWSGWAARMGVVFLSAGLLFGLVSIVLNSGLSMTRAGSSGLTYQSWDSIEKVRPTRSPEHYTIFFPTPEASDEPETLPDFPIPTPTLPAETAPGEEEPDISPVNRVVIPVLGLDTIVKYVPYDGLSWLIAGLQQEVAWLGDTSWPGLGSNTALAGHVTTRFGGDGPFRHLYLLEPGDRITVFTEQNSYNYTVRSTAVVEETDLEVLKETPGSQITLITCTAWDEENRYYTRRLIVYADLVSVFPVDRISSR